MVLFFGYLSEVANAGCFSRISRNHFKPIIHLLSPNSSSASEVSILRIVCRKHLNLHIFTTYITSHTRHHQRRAISGQHGLATVPERCPSGQARQRALAIGRLVFEVKKGTGRGRLFLLRQLFPGLLGRRRAWESKGSVEKNENSGWNLWEFIMITSYLWCFFSSNYHYIF